MNEPRKIFVGGLSWETTKEGLCNHFSQFGEVEDAVIMADPSTKKPRGFGFVTFKEEAGMTLALGSGPHIIDGKTVDPKAATMKGDTQGYDNPAASEAKVKKIFVGGLSNETSADDVKAYFEHFGEVSDIDLKYDKETSRMRGFGFVGFTQEESVEKAVQTHFHQINGKTVEAKKAEPRHQAVGGGGGPYNKRTPQQQVPATYSQYGAGAYGGGYGSGQYQTGYSQQQTQQQQQQQQQQYAAGYGYNQYTAAAAAQLAAGYGNYGSGQQVGTVQSQRMPTYGQDANAYSRAGYNAEAAYTSYGYESPYGDGSQAATPGATSYSRVGQGQQSQRSFGF